MVQQQRKRLQEAQLLQRSRTMLRVVSLNISLSHSRSLKVSRNDTLEYGVCKLKVFRSAGRGDLVRHRQSTVDCHARGGLAQCRRHGTSDDNTDLCRMSSSTNRAFRHSDASASQHAVRRQSWSADRTNFDSLGRWRHARER